MISYVVKFVSFERRSGKTDIASKIVSNLKAKGYIVGVVKHSHGEIDVAEKDSFIYANAGADIVVVSSTNKGAIFYSKWVDDLPTILKYLDTPIIVVEGFKESEVGDTIAVINKIEEFELAKKLKNLIAIVAENTIADTLKKNSEVPIYTKSDVDKIAELIENKMLIHIESKTPQLNCGYCGYETCKAFAKAYAMGKTSWCPVKLDVKLMVNNKPIPLNPFVKNALKSTIEGFISSLKGVEEKKEKILIEINYTQT
ncbi:molybdopterin-guanine dinucleotide biosynthesis protein B [Ignisphaera sp. 4213-co]|uniref:Molybdopterin-guanine dinucleotide biosynthesis protein B n=1 Tax=Ignisphaera cupida TaxID=3050454 RepID=A0ABD4Z848_9CREN|nr:molybdopterin-guanine dinucleotide biosynthesis protein B [Ignisphaera sp. 4213-co]MDK6029375.1 molybdopterin-guanine dinucleotide biosynthesis protein B [Ignisphaera sp. 4213-co]